MAELEYTDIDDKIKYCTDVILKEAKLEDVLVKQLFYTMLSMYSNDPRNLRIEAPTGEGKNYAIKIVADKFPKEDVIKYVGMSDKSIFHKSGKLVIKNDSGEYEEIEQTIEKLDADIEGKQSELQTTKDENLKQGLKSQIKDLEREKKRLVGDTKKLIDLSHKCIIFLDTPRPELLNTMMSLLSHDEYEVEYDFVDTSHGIKTRTNILRGWPVMIFAQAIDFSHHKRYAEIQRRFIVANPRMDEAKYKAAIKHIVYKHSVPHFMYEKTVVSDEEKNRAREIIKGLKEKIIDISSSVTNIGNNNVFVPFDEAIYTSLATKKAGDMTIADRIIGYLTLLAQVNVEGRPIITYREKGQPITQNIPLATFADLKEALFLMQYSNGVRPYVLEWYYGVFLSAYKEKTDVDSKPSPNGRDILKESRIAVTTDQLAKATTIKKGKKLSSKYLRDTYLDQLINQGYIDKVVSDLDKRTEIYFPVIEARESISTLADSDNETELGRYTFFCHKHYFPTPFYLRSKIQALLGYADENTICEIKNNLDIDSLIEKYYSNPEEVFKTDTDSNNNNDSNNSNSIDDNNNNNDDDSNNNNSIVVEQQKSDYIESITIEENNTIEGTQDRENIFSKSTNSSAHPNGAQNELDLVNEAQKYCLSEKKAYRCIPDKEESNECNKELDKSSVLEDKDDSPYWNRIKDQWGGT